MENQTVIEVTSLTKIYKIFNKPIDRVKEALSPINKRYSHDFYALKNVSFSVKRGENIGFIGKNGAGKSTLLKLITGVLTPSAGNIKVNGRIASLLELGAGFNPEMTGVENIFFYGIVMGKSEKEIEAVKNDIIAFADIGEFINQPVKTYSSGMFARLAFAVNAYVEPDILIVDEALSVGDNQFQMKCMHKMQELIEGGTSILFVSHDVNVIRRFCHKAMWLDHGEVKAYGEVNTIADQYMDFLKLNDKKTEETTEKAKQPDPDKNKKTKHSNTNKEVAAEIKNIRLYNAKEQQIHTISYDEPLTVAVDYEVYEPNLPNPVLGIAIKSINGDYICGLNTLLDKAPIPWKKGKNSFSLEYTKGVRLLGGTYYLDVALMEETATIPIEYLARAIEFQVVAAYKGEGVLIMEHDWMKNNKRGIHND